MKDALIPRRVKINNWIALSTPLRKDNCCEVCGSKLGTMAIILHLNCYKLLHYRWIHLACFEELSKSKSFLAQGYPSSKCSWCDKGLNDKYVVRFADVAYFHEGCIDFVVDAVNEIRNKYGPLMLAREI